MKKYFLTGLISLLPIALTLWIVKFLVDLLTTPFYGVVHELLLIFGDHFVYLKNHDTIALFLSRVIVLIFICFLILLIGFLARRFIIGYIIDLFHRIMLRIPIVKALYKIIVDITKTFIPADGKNIFESTVMVPFPYDKCHALGFQIGKIPDEAARKGGFVDANLEYKTIFVPTSPHPISGFLLMMESTDVKKVDISTEDAFKFLISTGLFRPEDKVHPPTS